jgi:hypothetical protein
MQVPGLAVAGRPAQVEVPHEDVEAFLHRVGSLRSYHRCELDRIGEMRGVCERTSYPTFLVL